MRRFGLFYIAPTLLVLLATLWPVVSGSETFYLRDVLTTHYPFKAAAAEALRQGELPLVDLYRAGGQPLLGNPNGVPLYPDNLLYLVGTSMWALNAHFWLHLLLAPLAFYWLGRAWGLPGSSAWAAGVCYTASGFMLSLANLYNLVAGAALAPALIAASLDAWSGVRPRRSLSAMALLWTLLLLAGDPLFAALSLAAAGLAGMVRHPRPPRRWVRFAFALVCGTALAAPMLVEFGRILPLSLRGYRSYSATSALLQSWDPRGAIEWFLPLFFGRPDFNFWGQRFYDGLPPLFYSLSPGLLCFVLIALASPRRGAAALWGWLTVALGLFLALGKWNPVVRLLYEVPGASVLRYPVKVWLLVALGAALLCGVGFERLVDRGAADGGAAGRDARRVAARVLALLASLQIAVWVLIGLTPWGDLLRALDPQRLAGPAFDQQRLHWMGSCLLSLGFLALLALALYMVGRRGELGGALLLAVHLVSQLFFLRPLLDSDDVRPYLKPPELLALIPAEARLVHGRFKDLFGPPALHPSSLSFPDARTLWLTRGHFDQLYPFAGIPWGRRYEFNPSPEGLDSFFTFSLVKIMPRLSDAERLGILEASGVDFLLLDRALDLALEDHFQPERIRLRAKMPTSLGDLHVYELIRRADPVQLVTRVHRVPHMNAALSLMTSTSFDPLREVILPEDEAASSEAVSSGGSAEILRETADEMEIRVAAPDGGVLLVQRTFHAIYRATVDGEEAGLVPANLHRLGIELPPGARQVRIWADRGQGRLAWGLAFLGLLGIGGLWSFQTAEARE